MFNKLQEIEKSSFGKNIIDTIALQIKNKSPLGDIAKMLAEVKQEMIIGQKQDDQLHALRTQECIDEIAEYERRIGVANQERDEAEGSISVLKPEITQAEGEINQKSTQLAILEAREAELRTQRLRDAEAFAERMAKANEVLEAIDLILDKLNGLGGNAPVSDEEAFIQLAKIGNQNPIMALVQIAASFSEEALGNVIEKVGDVKVETEQQMEEDKAQEEAAIAEFNIIVAELDE